MKDPNIRFAVFSDNRLLSVCEVHRSAIDHALREARKGHVAQVIDVGSFVPRVTFTADERKNWLGLYWAGASRAHVVGFVPHSEEPNDDFSRFVQEAIEHGEASEAMDAIAE